MPSQFFGLNISYSALVSANAALNTTSNNIANEETKGYSKQAVVTQASEALRVFTSYGCAGAGVDTLAIERLRNEYYDVRYWNNNANVGEFSVKDQYANIIQNYFRDDEYITGFSTIFDQMCNGLQEVKKHSGDATYRQAFLTRALELTDYFNSTYANLQKLQKDLNLELKTSVDQINSYASQIAALNKQINVVELSGAAANELRDQRGYLIDKLSELIDVEVKETPVTDPNNPDRVTGATKCVVKIGGGQMLVSGTGYNTLECVARSNVGKVNRSDADGLYDVRWSNGNVFDFKNASMGGTMKGIIDMRDGNNNEYFYGTIAETESSRDEDGVLRYTVKVEVDAGYLQSISKSNLSENGKIRLFDQEMYYDSFTFEYDGTTGKYFYNFELSDSTLNPAPLGGNKVGKEAYIGYGNEYQGIPYYMQQMGEWLRDYAEAFNDIVTQEGAVNADGGPGVSVFRAEDEAGKGQIDCKKVTTGDPNGSYTISSKDSTYYKITAGTIAINTAVRKNASLLATHTVATDGQDKYDILDQLVALQTNKDMMSFRGRSAGEFLQCILADISLNTQSAITFHDKYKDFGANIDNLRMSVSGVDKDEEGVDLVKYQNAYTLASKMINCFTEIYDRLILQTGV